MTNSIITLCIVFVILKNKSKLLTKKKEKNNNDMDFSTAVLSQDCRCAKNILKPPEKEWPSNLKDRKNDSYEKLKHML